MIMVGSTFDPSHTIAPEYQSTYWPQAGKFHPTGCAEPRKHSQPIPSAPLAGACYA